MRKTIFFYLIVAVIFLNACNNNQSANKTNNSSTNNKLELVFEDSIYQITGIAKKDGSALIVNYPRWQDVYRYAAIETNDLHNVEPYPNEAMNLWKPGEDGKGKWVCVQSSYFDGNGNLWILDPAAPKLKTIQGNGAKLVKINTASKSIERTYSFMSILPDTAYVNDVRIDVKRQFAYLTESKGGGIIVLDLNTGNMRRVLAKHHSVISDTVFKFIIDGHELMKDGKPAKFNSDGIALTPDGNWLYYKPLTDDKLYRIQTAYLRDTNTPDSSLYLKVQDLGHFTTTDGMLFDKNGTLYLGDLQHSSIIKVDTATLRMTTILQDDKLIWPDSYAIADGYLYISCSQIQKQPEYNNGVNKRTTPYTVYRLKL